MSRLIYYDFSFKRDLRSAIGFRYDFHDDVITGVKRGLFEFALKVALGEVILGSCVRKWYWKNSFLS
jgi:hypothetical protein